MNKLYDEVQEYNFPIPEHQLDDDGVILCNDGFSSQVIREFRIRTIYGRRFLVIGKDSDGK